MDYLGKDIPKLGFGLMRLPMLGGEVDIEQTKTMVDRFLESGFTYFDTAYGYIGGKSEEAVKAAIVDRYPRDRFYLATKLPAWGGAKDAAEAKAMLATSLKRTGAGYFDFYLLHNLGDNRTKVFDDFGIWDFVQEQKAKGVLRHVGFSMHDKADALDEVLTKHPEMEFVQLQINYNDWLSDSVESKKCYEVARRHGKPVIVMEPVKGGSLSTLPDAAAAPMRALKPDASLSSWAMRFAASLEGVITVLSGMSTAAQMEDNLKTMSNFAKLTAPEYEALEQVNAVLASMPRVPCTGCQYCMKGCPQEINIPGVLENLNSYLVYNSLSSAKGGYHWATMRGGKACACIACGQCEEVCPQHIAIISELQRASSLFD